MLPASRPAPSRTTSTRFPSGSTAASRRPAAEYSYPHTAPSGSMRPVHAPRES